MSNETIALWPDGDWCFLSDVETIAVEKNSDDYELIKKDNPLYIEIVRHGEGLRMCETPMKKAEKKERLDYEDKVALWPDRDWCFVSDLEDFIKSKNKNPDNYQVIVPYNPMKI